MFDVETLANGVLLFAASINRINKYIFLDSKRTSNTCDTNDTKFPFSQVRCGYISQWKYSVEHCICPFITCASDLQLNLPSSITFAHLTIRINNIACSSGIQTRWRTSTIEDDLVSPREMNCRSAAGICICPMRIGALGVGSC